MKKKAKETIAGENVTYKWWLQFNEELSEVLSDDRLNDVLLEKPQSVKDGEIESIISFFPLKMMVPTTIGKLGIMTFNRAENEGIYPLGLINKNHTKVNFFKRYVLWSPRRYMGHDLSHVVGQFFSDGLYSPGHILFRKKILDSMENLPIDKRKKAEKIYFELTHEEEVACKLFPHNSKRLELSIESLEFYEYKKKDEKRERIINSYKDAFMEAYNQAQSHYN